MKKVAILSDTHNILKEEVLNYLVGCDYIIHAGDFCKKEIYDQLNKIAPLYAVKGNNDGVWAANLPEHLFFQIEEVHFYMTHRQVDILSDIQNIDIIVFGHSHQYFYENKDDYLMLNPGGCGRKRFHLPLTMVLMEIEGHHYRIKKIEL